jgi:hypothetical protein
LLAGDPVGVLHDHVRRQDPKFASFSLDNADLATMRVRGFGTIEKNPTPARTFGRRVRVGVNTVAIGIEDTRHLHALAPWG